MQLKLSVGEDMLTIDVKATDTFQDISERLCSLGNIKVDMNQLRSSNNDKPFDMSTNVIDYFTKAVKDASPSQQQETTPVPSSKPGGLCRLCGEVITASSHFLFESTQDNITLGEKVNAALPIHVSKKDSHPKQVCDNCLGHLEESYDFMRTVVEAQNILETRVKPCETFRHTHKNDRCPLCNNGFLMQVNIKQEPKSSKKSWSEKGVTVQVPKYTNTKVSSKRARMDDENLSTEYYQSDEVVTGYWEPRKTSTSSGDDSYSTMLNSYSPYGGSGRKYRKRMKNEDDQDWTIDEEYIPVSRRGRPKGTKNKPKVVSVIRKSCVHCDWTGADLDMLAHTINFHCQPDLGYFPCPMCKTRHANEMELEAHVDEHNMTARRMK
ncbi:hypothetical protein GE061_017448 [Apolygus lucorum]|uniref:Uncharacterized protein n=1 Tax=Apolygus lucorum TaxID=248454 RepID=A0A6A4J7R7_APOLU|nr:hypothetical protein GE061_017448 [Apolygus lucorum]